MVSTVSREQPIDLRVPSRDANHDIVHASMSDGGLQLLTRYVGHVPSILQSLGETPFGCRLGSCHLVQFSDTSSNSWQCRDYTRYRSVVSQDWESW